MQLSDYEKTLLLIVMVREAGGDGVAAMRAVAHVVRNRVNAGWGTWLGVITAPRQFSSISVIGDPNTVRYPSVADFEKVATLVQDVYLGTDPDPTGGALYYENPAIATSDWFTQNIVNRPQEHPFAGKFGQQNFYR